MKGERVFCKDNVGLLAAAVLVFTLHLITVNQYGYFRDELYYIASTDHLDFGYVDHPPLSIALLAMTRSILGDSLLAVRLLPALCSAVFVLLAGLMAREFGGGWFARTVTGLSVVFSVYLFLFHIYSMNFLDFMFWALAFFVLIHILRGGRNRLWVLLGIVLGLGLLNKISILWLGAGLLVGLVLTHHRLLLRTRWPWVAGSIAVLLFLPYVAWQIVHGWPTLEFMRNATQYKMVAIPPLEFLTNQIFVMNPVNAPIWILGLFFGLFARDMREWRIFPWIFLAVAAVLIISGESRAYYLGPAYPPVLALGAVAIERFIGRIGWTWLKPALIAVILMGGAVMTPLGLPILPPEQYIEHAERLGMRPPAEERSELGELPQHLADMFGWEEMAATVARVYESLPPEDRAECGIFAHNYGEAGAIDVLGRKYGLPKAMCGHNSCWLWGPGDWSGEVVIIIGGDIDDHLASLEEVAPADTIRSRYAMPYENNLPVYVGRKLKMPVEELWPLVRFFI